jgi:photosystem II Psb27 protein
MARLSLTVFAAVLASAAAFSAPTPCAGPLARSKLSQSHVTMDASATRRGVLVAGVAAFAAASFELAPAEAAAEYKLSKDYLADASNLIANMKLATNLTRGEAGFEDTVVATRKEMNDFVAYYRRQARYSGAQSFNTIYTAINTLSGHYASFGNTYPVPAKRRDRLTVQYREIEKLLKRGR